MVLRPVLVVLAATLGLPGCATPGKAHLPVRSESVMVQFSGVTCVTRVDAAGRCWCVIENDDGEEIMAVSYDEDTGAERWETQRLFGLDEDALQALEGEGDPARLLDPRTWVAGSLWVTGLEELAASPEEEGVLLRQSQLLASLVGVLSPERPSGASVFDLIWGPDGCSVAPDLDIGGCCVGHDLCYGRALDSRADCDEALCDCIEEAGHPILARLYFAAVRAFGWVTYGRGI